MNVQCVGALIKEAELLAENGRQVEAIARCRRALELLPHQAAARLLLAHLLHESRQFEEAAQEYQRITRLEPLNARAWNAYGTLFANMHQPANAVHCFRCALAIRPEVPHFNSNLGMALAKQGRVDLAVQYFRQALAIKPDASAIHSNLLLACNMQHRQNENLMPEHREWAVRHAARLYPSSPANTAPPDASISRVRIGYISADFRRHPVAYFFQPLLREHNRNAFEIFCYSDVRRPDETTGAIRGRADHWRRITGFADEKVAEQIRADQLDILVDLSGHMGNHRLLVFARRVAPVQVTYLAYPNTTGLETMDFRLTDAESDPPGLTETHYTETLVRLPAGFLCYQPPDDSPPVRQTYPHERTGITFGCFNNFAKVTPWMLALWARVLIALPNSRLIIKADGLSSEQARADTTAALAQLGVHESRVELLGRIRSFADHLGAYHRLDIALDTFPYHGTTTTCEAMWMGVPVITLAGKSHRSRVGASLLKCVGLGDMVSSTPDQYIAIAVALAKDVDRRRQIASQSRDRMLDSPLTRGRDFVRGLEAAYLSMLRLPRRGTAG